MPHTTLISTDQLVALLATPLNSSTVIVDCRYDLANEEWGVSLYREGHLPGAVYASLSHDLAAEPDGTNGRHPIPSPEKMAATFSRLGIGPGVQVIAYDQDTGMYASRLWWMLRYLGHDSVAVLDGGWAKWQREGRPARSGDETNVAQVFVPDVREAMRLSLGDVERLSGNPSAVLVDARAAERFEGKTEPLDRVAGHIPGARNFFYRQNVAADGTMLPADTLKQQFAAALGGREPSDVVMYCGSGVSACHNLLAMEHAGLKGTKLYPGSWSEWAADPKRPVETGPATTLGTPPKA